MFVEVARENVVGDAGEGREGLSPMLNKIKSLSMTTTHTHATNP